MIELRPHHLLCIFGWRGQGYSPAFTENFNRIIKALETERELRLVGDDDDICRCCPNHKPPAGCLLEQSGRLSPEGIDRRVAERLSLSSGQVYPAKLLLERIKREIKPEELAYICRGCSWLELGWCASGLKGCRPESA